MIQLTDIVIIKDKNPKIGVLPITEEESKELEQDIELYFNGKLKLYDFIIKYKFQPLHAIMFGNTNDVTSNDLQGYIDFTDVIVDGLKSRRSYKCFCGENFGLDYKKEILHGSSYDSWRCVMTKLNNPKYAVILNLTSIENEVKL